MSPFPPPVARSPAELAVLARIPGAPEEWGPLADTPCLLVDLDGHPAAAEEIAAIVELLARIPCPTLGYGGGSAAELARHLDVVVADAGQLAAPLANIARHPQAAATLVQLLRHNERASLQDGLLAESLAYGVLQAGVDFRSFLAGRPPPHLASDAEPLRVERTDDRLTLTLNRPEKRNAYSAGMRDALYEALLLLEADPGLTAELRGAGACFCTGGDLDEFGLATDPAAAHCLRMSRHVGLCIARHAARIECRVHRACIGSGIELPAFAGRLVATHDTYFHLPEITIGLIPGAGGTVSILRRIGRQRTAWLALSARRIDAPTALAWGLVDALAQDV